MSKPFVARARVQMTVEFTISDTWEEDCKIDQVMKQSQEAAKEAVMRGLVINGLTIAGGNKEMKTPAVVVGTPRVTMVLVAENERE